MFRSVLLSLFSLAFTGCALTSAGLKASSTSFYQNEKTVGSATLIGDDPGFYNVNFYGAVHVTFVKIDGQPVQRSFWGEPVQKAYLAPGSHRVLVSMAGSEYWRAEASVTVEANPNQTVLINVDRESDSFTLKVWNCDSEGKPVSITQQISGPSYREAPQTVMPIMVPMKR